MDVIGGPHTIWYFQCSSAPKVWQRHMHEFVEDLEGVKVIADDLLNVGFDQSNEEINRSLELESQAQQSQDETSSNQSTV